MVDAVVDVASGAHSCYDVASVSTVSSLVDLTVGEACPWTSLGLKSGDVTQHLSATQRQLDRLKVVTKAALRSSFRSQSEEVCKLLTEEHCLRTTLAAAVIEHQSSLNDLANLLSEIYLYRSRDETKLATSAAADLSQKWKETKDRFNVQKECLLKALEKQKERSIACAQLADSAACSRWIWLAISSGLGLGAIVVSAPMIRLLGAPPEPAKESRSWNIVMLVIEFLARALSPSRSGEKCLSDSVAVFYPILPVTMLAFSGTTWMWFWKARAAAMNNLQMQASADANAAFVRANEEMWDGMGQLVDSLWMKVEEFSKIDPNRQVRVRTTLNSIGTLAWNMKMSADTYMVWLERHGIFSSNVSVPKLVGSDTYKAISGELSPRGWFF